MIEAILYYESIQFDKVLDGLMRLLGPLKPIGFGYDEDKDTGNRIDNSRSFGKFLTNSKSGFVLYAEHVQYGFCIAKSGEFNIYILHMEPSESEYLIRELSAIGVQFAYAAENAERIHRNRLIKKAQYGIDEAWVGRDWRRYIPGLYWITVIPNALAQQHVVPLEVLKHTAAHIEEATPGVWILQFFEKPDQWIKYAGQLDRLCKEEPGIFSITRVRPAFEQASTFLEVAEILHGWR